MSHVTHMKSSWHIHRSAYEHGGGGGAVALVVDYGYEARVWPFQG